MIMSRKTWLSACGALLMAGLASTASASITFSVNLTAIDGVPLGAAENKKLAMVTSVGQRFSFDMWVTIQGSNAARDEDYAQMFGGLISYAPLAGAGGTRRAGVGHFRPAGEPVLDPDTGEPIPGAFEWFNGPLGGGTGSQNGAENHILSLNTVFGNMPDDGSPDIGHPVPTSPLDKGDWMSQIPLEKYTNRSPVPGGLRSFTSLDGSLRQVITTPNPFGFKMKLLSFDWVVESMSNGAGDQTAINWLPRIDTTLAGGAAVSAAAASWTDDNTTFTGQTGEVNIDAPVILQIVPEPASLSILALGALGLLARRRK